MRKKSLASQAEELWLRLCDAQAEARASGNHGRALRIEPMKDRAWFRMLRRLNCARVHGRSMIRRQARANSRAQHGGRA